MSEENKNENEIEVEKTEHFAKVFWDSLRVGFKHDQGKIAPPYNELDEAEKKKFKEELLPKMVEASGEEKGRIEEIKNNVRQDLKLFRMFDILKKAKDWDLLNQSIAYVLEIPVSFEDGPQIAALIKSIDPRIFDQIGYFQCHYFDGGFKVMIRFHSHQMDSLRLLFRTFKIPYSHIEESTKKHLSVIDDIKNNIELSESQLMDKKLVSLKKEYGEDFLDKLYEKTDNLPMP